VLAGAPKEEAHSMFHKLALGVAATFVFTLSASAAETAAVEMVNVRADREVVCKTYTTPGSLVGRHRICMTRDSWEALRNRSQHNLVRVQDQALFVNSVMAKPGG
jgi:hypothetical protein